MKRWLPLAGALLALLCAVLANLAIGATSIPLANVVGAFAAFDANSYDHHIVLTQRLPRALIAIYGGAITAAAGVVLQGLTRNPLASPATLGLNAGASLAVVAAALVWDAGFSGQGVAALAGALAGFLLTLLVVRLTGAPGGSRGLALVLAGVLVSILLSGIANALLLADPARRMDLLGWVTGNINPAYADRLAAIWWVGAAALALLLVLARPLTLITLGTEKAASAGVPLQPVRWLAIGACAIGCGSAVSICGPVGFVGLVVPHMIRPFCGGSFAVQLPAAALVGAAFCLLADLLARNAFAPYVLHTGVVMDVVGGLAFAFIVKRLYLSPGQGRPA